MYHKQTGKINILPFILVIIGVVAMISLVNFGAKPMRDVVEPIPPKVLYAPAKFEQHTITVHSQGVVLPSTEIELATDVTGVIKDVSPKLVNGSFFNKNEVLLTLDSSFYEAEVARSISFLETARLSLTQAKSRNAAALIKEAEARELAMQAGLQLARTQLEKTKVRAPFAGRIRERRVGVGQYVTPGFPLARIYATNQMTVRLPLADELLDHVFLPNPLPENQDDTQTSKVVFVSESSGKRYTWEGYLAGLEGAVNERNRLQFLVSVIPTPYLPDPEQSERPLLAVGQFIKAEIEGDTLTDVIKLPRYLLRSDNQILVVDEQDRLQLRKVSIKYRGRKYLYLDGGVQEGEKIVITPLGISVAGARVTPVLYEASTPVEPVGGNE